MADRPRESTVPFAFAFSLFYVNLLAILFCLLLQALMALFVLASKDGWVSIMYSGLDAVGVDQQVANL